MQKLTLIRGLPGSGKSTYAKRLNCKNHFETDDWFTTQDGTYTFSGAELSKAHDECRRKTFLALGRGEDVVVANTFVRRSSLQPYLDAAWEVGANVRIVAMTGKFGSIHGVPETTMARMRRDWED